MPSGETPEGESGGLLESVFAPLRLPDRLLKALDEVAVSVRDLAPMRAELIRIREHTEPLDEHVVDLHDTFETVDRRLVALERSVSQIRDEVHAIHETVDEVKFDIQRVTGLRGERGLLERVRDKMTGGDPREPREGEDPRQAEEPRQE